MLAHELYRRALATLTEVETLHVHSRSISYRFSARPQCALVRRCVHFRAPDRLSDTLFDCNPVAVPQRSDFVQVGKRAFHRSPTSTAGAWHEHEPVVTTPDDLPTLITGWMDLPSVNPTAGGVFATTAFLLPIVTTIRLDGREHRTLAFPVIRQRHPMLHFPGDPMPRGGHVHGISYRGENRHPERVIGEGTLFVDERTARPLRYLIASTATLQDGATVLLDRTHVRFWYDSEAAIELSRLEHPE